MVRSETALAAAAVLAALDARPAGVPVRSAGTDRPGDPHLRELFRVEPAALLVPFDNTAGGSLRGVPVAHGTLVVTNQYLQFDGDQASDVVWPVRDIHELVVTPEGLFLRTDGVSTVRGVGAGPGWAPLLPLLVEWASAVHTDDSLESVRARVRRLATGATGL